MGGGSFGDIYLGVGANGEKVSLVGFFDEITVTAGQNGVKKSIFKTMEAERKAAIIWKSNVINYEWWGTNAQTLYCHCLEFQTAARKEPHCLQSFLRFSR